jgi:hypothetical protein
MMRACTPAMRHFPPDKLTRSNARYPETPYRLYLRGDGCFRCKADHGGSSREWLLQVCTVDYCFNYCIDLAEES